MTHPQLRVGGLNQRGRDYLDSFGIDAYSVSTVGHNVEGYIELKHTGEPNVYNLVRDDEGRVLETERSWPKGFSYAELIRLSWEENDG